jgi:hypothetical protein
MLLQVGANVFNFLWGRVNVHIWLACFHYDDASTPVLRVNQKDSHRVYPGLRGDCGARFEPLKPAGHVAGQSDSRVIKDRSNRSGSSLVNGLFRLLTSP